MAVNPLLRALGKNASLTDAELMVGLSTRIHCLLPRRTRYTPDLVAPADLPDLVRQS